MTLIISNEEMNDIMKVIKFLKDSGLIIKGVNQTVKNEAREQNGEFLEVLLGTLDDSLLGNLLKGKGTIRPRKVTIGSCEGTVRAVKDS